MSIDVVTLTDRLVAARSENPGGDERRVAAEITDVCSELGLPAPIRLGDPHRPNLLVTVDFGPGGRRFGLGGHTDTKPVGAGEWSTDPFRATEVDGHLYGRGVVDMKGAVAAMLLAAADIAHEDPPERSALVLVLCADEEHGATWGARLLTTEHTVDLDALVIGEPAGLETDWDRLHLGSRGIANFDLTVTTRQAHSGLRDLLDLPSATEIAARLTVALADELDLPVPPASPHRPTLNPGVVLEGGVTYGVIPGSARVASDCRLVPGMDRAELEKAVATLVERHAPPGTVSFELRNWIQAVALADDHPLVRLAAASMEATLGAAPPTDLFPATTDATWFDAVGIPTLPALGPGLLAHAHAPDERISVASLHQARRLYADLGRRALGEAA